MKLINIYEQLINEFVNQNSDTIIQAINNKRLINIYYDDDRTGLRGWRRVEPFCLGKNKYGNDVLRAWQEHGVSASYPPGKEKDPLTNIPGWRMFRVDKITNINTTGNDQFVNPRPKYNDKDKDMVTIYAAAEFDNGYTDPASIAPNNPNPAPMTPQGQSNMPVSPSPKQSGYASYKSEPAEVQPEVIDKKASLFDKWATKFKNLVGYKPK